MEKMFDLINRVATKLTVTTSWGLHPEKGWSRPLCINHNGEWYMFAGTDKYCKEPYYDYTEDIKNGLYVPMGIKDEE